MIKHPKLAWFAAFAGLFLLLGAPAGAQVVNEVEDNSRFLFDGVSGSQFVGLAREVAATLTDGDGPDTLNNPFDRISSSIAPDQVVDFTGSNSPFTGLTPGDPFAIVFDNTVGGGAPDLTAGFFSGPPPSAATLIGSDDDSSPLGNGDAPILAGTVGASGQLDFAVSGFPDEEAIGAVGHPETGDFDALLYTGGVARSLAIFAADEEDSVEGDFAGDVDFFTFSGLTPGSIFTAETFDRDTATASPDTELGYFRADGRILAFNDDGGPEEDDFFSQIAGVVPGSGEVTLGVTGFDDFAFLGFHEDEEGDYGLRIREGAPSESIVGVFLLPNNIDNGVFDFVDVDIDEPGQLIIFDPDVATGYSYELAESDIFFNSIIAPVVDGDTEFELFLSDGGDFIFEALIFAGDEFFFGPDVTKFQLRGIDISALLDPNDPLAFPLAISFTDSGTVNLTQTALTTFFDPNPDVLPGQTIPEPRSWTIFAIGLLAVMGLATVRRRRLTSETGMAR